MRKQPQWSMGRSSTGKHEKGRGREDAHISESRCGAPLVLEEARGWIPARQPVRRPALLGNFQDRFFAVLLMTRRTSHHNNLGWGTHNPFFSVIASATRQRESELAYALANCASIAATSAGSSGLVLGANRAATSPLRLTRNFSKFQSNSGAAFGEMPYLRRSSSDGTSLVLMALGCAP